MSPSASGGAGLCCGSGSGPGPLPGPQLQALCSQPLLQVPSGDWPEWGGLGWEEEGGNWKWPCGSLDLALVARGGKGSPRPLWGVRGGEWQVGQATELDPKAMFLD